MGSLSMCGPKGYGFLVILVINRVRYTCSVYFIFSGFHFISYLLLSHFTIPLSPLPVEAQTSGTKRHWASIGLLTPTLLESVMNPN